MAPYEPPVAHYAHVDVSDYDESMILCMVGKGGEGFYKLTDWLRLDYVWFDSENKRIELWGPFKSFENGCRQKLENSLKDFSSRFTVKNNAC